MPANAIIPEPYLFKVTPFASIAAMSITLVFFQVILWGKESMERIGADKNMQQVRGTNIQMEPIIAAIQHLPIDTVRPISSQSGQAFGSG